MMRALILGCLAVATCDAQGDERQVFSFDGGALERVSVQGTPRWIHEADPETRGTGSLRIAPATGENYYGVTIRGLRGAAPKRLRLRVCNQRTDPVRWFVSMQKFEPVRSKRRGLKWSSSSHQLQPGWSELDLDLTALQARDAEGPIDTTLGIGAFRISRRARGPDEPPLRVDSLRFVDETAPRALIKRLKSGLRLEDPFQRRRAVQETLPCLPDQERVTTSLDLLAQEGQLPSIRTAARQAIATASAPRSIEAPISAIKRARGTAAAELLWALASMPSEDARAHVKALLQNPRISTEQRTALLGAMGRRHISDVAALETRIDSRRPWPERAALVKALLTCACEASMDALIKILADPGSERVRNDAAAALTRLTGKDLGTAASQWESWWQVNRGKVPLNDTGKTLRLPYARYYGIPVPNGRTTFVIDLSGSMREPVEGGRAAEHLRQAPHLKDRRIRSRLDLAKEELAHVVSQLSDAAWVSVVTYSDGAQPVGSADALERASSRLKSKLAKRIRSLSAKGRTNIHDGLLRAFHPKKKPHKDDAVKGPDTIFLLTDGDPSVGAVTSRTELRDAVLAWNLGRMIRVHAINVGDARSLWLEQLTRATDGRFIDLSSDPGK